MNSVITLDVDWAAITATNWSDWITDSAKMLAYIVGGLVVLLVMRGLISAVTNRLARERRTPTSDLGAALARANPLTTERHRQRTRAVGSVLRSISDLTIMVLIVFLVLDELGVNIAPLLASAGIVGVALGIGAQSLVKDIITGVFILTEDQYGVGDVITVGDVNGTVESVELRVTKVRDAAGTLWFIPNGAITVVGNKTQQWAKASVEVDVDYFVDLDQVRQLLLTTAEQVAADPTVRSDLQGEPQVIGVERLSADAVTLKVEIRTSPARQWEVARLLRVAIRQALIDAGIPWGGQHELYGAQSSEKP